MHHVFLADTRPHQDAAELLILFGSAAAGEAAGRAARSRALGNHLHFCRWRQVERLLGVLEGEMAMGTVH